MNKYIFAVIFLFFVFASTLSAEVGQGIPFSKGPTSPPPSEPFDQKSFFASLKRAMFCPMAGNLFKNEKYRMNKKFSPVFRDYQTICK